MTNSRQFIALTLALGLASHSLLAQKTAQQQCLDTAMTQLSMDQCAGADLAAARARLARVHAAVDSAIAKDTIARRMLARADVQWRTFMTTQCTWEGRAYAGGSMQPMVEGNCLALLTNGRAEYLQSFVCGWDAQDFDCAAAKRLKVHTPSHQ